jgi:hypothetical protein
MPRAGYRFFTKKKERESFLLASRLTAHSTQHRPVLALGVVGGGGEGPNEQAQTCCAYIEPRVTLTCAIPRCWQNRPRPLMCPFGCGGLVTAVAVDQM